MRRLKKKIYLGLCAVTLGVLTAVRYTTSVAGPAEEADEPAVAPDSACASEASSLRQQAELPPQALPETAAPAVSKTPKPRQTKPHPIRSVPSYERAFPDAQDVQIGAARRWGVKPVLDRQQAEHRKDELVFVGADPFFDIDPAMRSSIPYLVPRASILLHDIGRNFLDSLGMKGVPLHKIIVTSVLRTESDVARLMQHNGNANEQSCHRFATTFDIAYNRYTTVSPPQGPERRTVRNDTLKWVLSEVLRDMRQQGRCYIKHEIKQGCFHITVR